MKKTKIDLFDYHDYRLFLKDWFSLRDIAETCSLSTGNLPMVLSIQRNLSKKALTKLKDNLKFNTEELIYFIYLLS